MNHCISPSSVASKSTQPKAIKSGQLNNKQQAVHLQRAQRRWRAATVYGVGRHLHAPSHKCQRQGACVAAGLSLAPLCTRRDCRRPLCKLEGLGGGTSSRRWGRTCCCWAVGMGKEGGRLQ
eukprot:scaffold120198_cov19-Tisochrysis_lutea.AAC.1